MRLVGAVAVAYLTFAAPVASPGVTRSTGSVEHWSGGGSGGLVQERHRDTGGDPKSRIVSDDHQAYKGTIDFKFTIDASGEITGSGKGKYYEAEWTLSGQNGDKGPIGCSPTITAKAFKVDVSGFRRNGAITLSLRLPDAQESNVDTPCPTNDFIAFGGTSQRLDESLAYSGGRAIKFKNLVTGSPDSYTATLEPPDEDRSGGDITKWTVQHFWGITIGPVDEHFFSQKDKDRLAKSSADLNVAAGGLAAGFVKDPAAVWGGLGSAAYWVLGAVNGRLALDPPDRHFRAIAKPRTPHFRTVTAGGTLNAAAASALNRLNKNDARIIAFGRAEVTSVERAQGAKRARNKRWQKRQLKAARKYARQDAAAIKANAHLRAAAKSALAASGYGGSGITLADVLAFQQDVRAHGLPGWLNGDLRAIGADASFRKQIKGSILLLDPNDVVAAAASIPNLLDSAALSAAFANAVKALRDFGG